MNSWRMKGIDIDEVFSMLVKIIKKVEFCVSLIGMELNWKDRLKTSSHRWVGRGDF